MPACLIVVGLLMSAPPARADDGGPGDGRHALKGWELYSWQEGAAWRFSLLIGTNRRKFCSEVKNPKGALDLAGAEEALGRLGELENVSWNGPARPQAPCPIARPPSDMAARLARVCQRRNLHCTNWDERAP